MGSLDRQRSRHRLSAAERSVAGRSHHWTNGASGGTDRAGSRVSSRNRCIRRPVSYHGGPGSGGGNPQEATAIRSTTTRQPDHQARQPKAENYLHFEATTDSPLTSKIAERDG